MKKLFLLIGAAILLTACNNDVVTNELPHKTEQTTEVTQGAEMVVDEKDLQLKKEYEA